MYPHLKNNKSPKFGQNVKDFQQAKNFAASRRNRSKTRGYGTLGCSKIGGARPPASKILRFSDIWICGIGDIADRVLMTTQGLYASLTIINTSLAVIRSLSAVSPMPKFHISENLRINGTGGARPPILLQPRVPTPHCFW